jgi:hypothetical protein
VGFLQASEPVSLRLVQHPGPSRPAAARGPSSDCDLRYGGITAINLSGTGPLSNCERGDMTMNEPLSWVQSVPPASSSTTATSGTAG